jgi:putative hydrolase of the HAD superfamily
MSAELRAVIFDLGGVVLGSPLHAIAAYEREVGLPDGFVNRVVAATAPGGAWARLERGELALEPFYGAFEADCAGAGHRLDARALFERMAQAAAPRPRMLAAVGRIRERGLRAAALTNTWTGAGGRGAGDLLRPRFDVFVESNAVGLRKPDPRIYQLACRELGVRAEQAVFLDDIGGNLKPARALGMTTIRVSDPDAALAELEAVLGFPLA